MWRSHFGLGGGVVGSNPILIKATVAQRCVPYGESKCEVKWWRGVCVCLCVECESKLELPCSNYAALLPPTHSALLPRLMVSCCYLVFTVFASVWFVLLPLHSFNSDIFGSFVLFLQHLSHQPSYPFLTPFSNKLSLCLCSSLWKFQAVFCPLASS